MALDDATRHALHLRLDDLVGSDLAGAMMTAYPPFGWDQVALKQDLLEMEERLTQRLTDRFEGSIHREIHQAITGQTRSIMFALVGVTLNNASLTLGAMALLR